MFIETTLCIQDFEKCIQFCIKLCVEFDHIDPRIILLKLTLSFRNSCFTVFVITPRVFLLSYYNNNMGYYSLSEFRNLIIFISNVGVSLRESKLVSLNVQ